MIEPRLTSTRRFVSQLGYFLSAICFLCLIGCNDDRVQHYKAYKPKETETPKTNNPEKTGQDSQKPNTRLLGLVVPDGNSTWYVKLLGSTEVIDSQAKAFDQFIESIKFPKEGNKPMTWTVPEGWRPGKGNQFSYAAFAMGPEGNSVELTVSQVGGSVLDNLNRWRVQQLNLTPITESEIAKTFPEIQIDGKKALKIDMLGTGSGKGMVPPFMKGR